MADGKKPASHCAIPAVEGGPSVYELLTEINSKIDVMNERLAKGDTAMTLFEHRIGQLERLVYGMVAVILLAVVGALVALVVK